MPDNEAFVHDLLLPDSNTRRFHAGDACQWSPPVPEGEVEPTVAAMIAAHRREIHAPGSRVSGAFGLDEEGNPIETSYLGVGVDPESGALVPLDNDGNPLRGSATGEIPLGSSAPPQVDPHSHPERDPKAETPPEATLAARERAAAPHPPQDKG